MKESNRIYKEELMLNGEFNIRTIVDVLRAKWYWFVVVVAISLSGAYLYLQTVPQLYKRTATVLIKGQEQTEDAFLEKQLFNRSRNVANEIIIFKSKALLTEVVKRLHLNVVYAVQEGLRQKILYPDSPLWVQFPVNHSVEDIRFSITPLTTETFRMENFFGQPEWSGEGRFGSPLTTPAGSITIEKTASFSNLYLEQTIYISRSNLEAVALSCKAGLEVEKANSEATLLNLSYQDVNPLRADAIINTLIDVYNDDAMRDKNQILLNTALFIDERLQIINNELGNVDGEIETFKKDNRLTDISSEANIYLQNNNRYQQEAIALNNQMELVQFIKAYLNDPAKEQELIPSNSGIMDTGVEAQISSYNGDLLLRNKLIKNSSESSPAVAALNVSLESLHNSIFYSLNNLQKSLQIRLQDTRRQEALVSQRIVSVPTQEKYMLTVERQQKIKEELYLYLLNKREENALSMATMESNVRVIDAAYGAGQGEGTSQMVILLAALLAGLAIPGLFFYLQPMLDVTVRGRKDIEEVLSVPLLGEIPHNPHSKKEHVIHANAHDVVSESFRIVRSNLGFMNMENEPVKVLMFTSANPSSGKTFVSSNLAISLSLTGKRVLLVELDIRKGSISNKQQKNPIGITNYLSGKITQIGDLIDQSNLYPNLHVIHSGPLPPNPAELLLSSRLDALMQQLRVEYDYILLDTVPYSMMADAQIISRVADLTVYVIREGYMDRRLLPEIEKLYQSHKLARMSVLLNDCGYRQNGYNYSYYGYRNYGGYGYGKKKKRWFGKKNSNA